MVCHLTCPPSAGVLPVGTHRHCGGWRISHWYAPDCHNLAPGTYREVSDELAVSFGFLKRYRLCSANPLFFLQQNKSRLLHKKKLTLGAPNLPCHPLLGWFWFLPSWHVDIQTDCNRETYVIMFLRVQFDIFYTIFDTESKSASCNTVN